MTRWPAPPLPDLPGQGTAVRLHDTATGDLLPAAAGPSARMYVCGITPYDATHLGHAATYVGFDLLNRAWRDAGLDVRYVQNVTDVDDPLLERAAATGVDWHDLAVQQTQLFADDMAALAVIPPEQYLGVIDTLPLVVDAVQRLIASGHAYTVPGHGGEPDGDVYFAINADPRFGEVSHLDDATMTAIFAERGGDPARPGKKHPLDPLLWRVARPDEPEWDGQTLGRGRPGWHIECTTIALEHLGMSFDVQGGGSDLAFPHHEMGASHAHALTGEYPFAKVYAHAGMVGYEGHKMSKSRGNLVLVSRLRAAGESPAAIRLALLAHHYRSDWEWTDADLSAARLRLARWREAVARRTGADAAPVLAGVRARLANDLDAPGALELVDGWAEATLAGASSSADAGDLVSRTVDALLGVQL
ncbi:MAG: cysteine--1-D-myo-inosityl 2-amino-2-deoxy-alpha-D-glucopyranoside ligase [Kineosporiaceae bacterium]|nr:cysteine--1-D-myo-inosityl 2-amino-2-deoxy-alpha-D-glucopyranoside ligase [Kineosporiaceae bacterium]MBK7624866.1 cysteine--1-D-myo-inosityl 2-amino-2-deoxy-alpha-D-glucopyranoside ligase [Kineosporiaceae bacterium]MBK8076755.1 cysteine--1-D-myo-inosityl 2-amino-2-deoxy-alpha-D-glucopyranoside ligase [Kineosporiaceae bacterium]